MFAFVAFVVRFHASLIRVSGFHGSHRSTDSENETEEKEKGYQRGECETEEGERRSRNREKRESSSVEKKCKPQEAEEGRKEGGERRVDRKKKELPKKRKACISRDGCDNECRSSRSSGNRESGRASVSVVEYCGQLQPSCQRYTEARVGGSSRLHFPGSCGHHQQLCRQEKSPLLSLSVFSYACCFPPLLRLESGLLRGVLGGFCV